MTSEPNGVFLGSRSLNGDAASGIPLLLGDGDVQDTVAEASEHGLGIYVTREVEAASELADAALGNPVFGAILGSLLATLFRGRADLGEALLLDRGLVVALRGLLARGDGPALSLLNARGGARRVGALDAAADDHGLGVGELDVDIILVHSRELAVELVVILRLSDVELWLEGGPEVAAVFSPRHLVTTLVGVEVLEEAEEGGETLVALSGSWKEDGHCVGVFDGLAELEGFCYCSWGS